MAAHRVGIIQSNYIPWKGYFDFIASVDEFVILDSVQYTRRDWRNRNLIKVREGTHWLTIPVEAKGKFLQSIDETRIADATWADQHLQSLRHAYARATHFEDTWPWIEALYESIRALDRLSQVNERIIRTTCQRLGIATPIHHSHDFALVDEPNQRLISICKQLNASEYLSGPAARPYLDLAAWHASGISVLFKSYVGYPQYPQLFPPFEHAVTILDVILNTGEAAAKFIHSERVIEAAHI